MRKKEFLFFLLLVFAAVFIRGFFLSHVKMVLPDEGYYLGMARSMAEGRDYGGFDPTPFRYTKANLGKRHGQPLFPLLLSWTGRMGKDPLLAARWTSVVASILTLILFHFCARLFSTPEETLISDAVYVFAPAAIRYSYLALNHSLFFLFLFAFLFFTLKVIATGRSSFAALAGMAAWGAYLTRFEIIIFVGFLALVGFFSKRRILAAVFAGTFTLLSLPLWIWIRKTTGVWQLDWSLTHGLREYLIASRPALPDPHAFWPTYFHRLGVSLSSAAKLLPVTLLALIGPGILQVFSRKGTGSRPLFLIFLFIVSPFIFYPIVNSDPRFYAPAFLFLFLFSGRGVTFLIRKIKRRKAVLLGCLLLAGVSFLPGYRSLLLGFDEEPFEQKQIGEWIRANFDTPGTFLVTDIRSCFYAGPLCKRSFSFYQAKNYGQGAAEFESFLEVNRIRLVAAGARDIKKIHPTFLFLLDAPPPYLVKIKEAGQGDNRVILYRYSPVKAGKAFGSPS